MLFLSSTHSDLRVFLEEVHRLAVSFPTLLSLIDADLDAHGLRKKAVRVADKAWTEAQAVLRGCEPAFAITAPATLTLGQGRERTPAYVVFVVLLLRGYFGEGFKGCSATTLMLESTTLAVLFANLGMSMPKPSTLTELVNAVTLATRQSVLDAQIAQVAKLGLDDFKTMLQDSTHVEGNTEWPTDSRLIVAIIARVLRVGATLASLSLPVLHSSKVLRDLAEMKTLDREIDLTHGTRQGTRTRRRRYEKLLRRAHRARKTLDAAVAVIEAALASLNVRPSRHAMATRAVTLLRADVTALQTMIANCEARIIEGKKVAMADKKLSVSDLDVGFIAKGQRNPVIGYKPQIARSGEGFITGLLLPQGNASDSGQLVPMVDEVIRRTTVVPDVLSVDDGYASQANLDALHQRHIEVISISGSKGKALTEHADWISEAYRDARNQRSAVESMMFTIKQGFHFGEVARRGLTAVHCELLEKVLAYNLCHLVRKQSAKDLAAIHRKAPLLAAA